MISKSRGVRDLMDEVDDNGNKSFMKAILTKTGNGGELYIHSRIARILFSLELLSLTFLFCFSFSEIVNCKRPVVVHSFHPFIGESKHSPVSQVPLIHQMLNLSQCKMKSSNVERHRHVKNHIRFRCSSHLLAPIAVFIDSDIAQCIRLYNKKKKEKEGNAIRDYFSVSKFG